MKNKLADVLSKESNMTFTENDAITYRSTLNSVLDFFYLAPARQDQDNTALFAAAFEQDPLLAMKALFYIRDCRGGKKQRRTMRDVLAYLYETDRALFTAIVPWVPEYGYWKELIPYVSSRAVVQLVQRQLALDYKAEHPSLLAKWMPSENTSSEDTVALSRQWMKALYLSPRSYRKLLTDLRARIDIPERKMSAGHWEDINYSAVPTRAMHMYRKAFKKHDEDRFVSFTSKAVKGEVKINASQIYPHEIVEKFLMRKGDQALEAMWNQLPNYFDEQDRRIMPLIDVSSSMSQHGVMHIGIALGLYCSERNTGPFKDLFITFSENPQIVKVTGKSLMTRVESIRNAHWGGHTNIQAAFELILRTAVENRVKKSDMPTHFFIFSDMEFNDTGGNRTNFDAIKKQYRDARYEMPMLVFWNLNARHNQTPVTKDQKNAFLVSGFAPEAIGKILNSEAYTPEQLMLETLNGERYAFLDNIIR